MLPQILVVSDPPHREVAHDAAAEILGLDIADLRAKVDFAAPEVLAASDEARAVEVATALRGSGLSVVVIDGCDLVDVPWPTSVSSFDFEADALVVRPEGGEVRLRYDTPITAVYCQPPAGFEAPEPGRHGPASATGEGGGFAISEDLEWTAHLDLYFTQGRRVRRIALVQDVAEAVAECAHRFHGLRLDTRLENVRPRKRFIGGDADFDLDLRKAYSFGTLLLRQMLESISPDLRDLTHYEFASRLSYLVSRARPRA